MFNKRIKIKELLATEPQGQSVTVMGWVRTFRNNQFVALNDGSTNNNLQVVIELGKYDDALLKRITTSASLKVTGTLVESLGKGQKVEVKAEEIEILGDSDAEAYPLQPKKHSLEFLREKAHLRFRTSTFGSVFRVRHSLAFAVHKFFNEKGFFYLHTPIVTASDAEGAGEMFRVTTLPIKNLPLLNKRMNEVAERYYQVVYDILKRKDFNFDLANKLIKGVCEEYTRTEKKNLSRSYGFKDLLTATDGDLRELKNLAKYFSKAHDLKNIFETAYEYLLGELFMNQNDQEFFTSEFSNKIFETSSKIAVARRFGIENHYYFKLSFFNFKRFDNKVKKDPQSYLDFSQDFFGRATNLTVSGQLEGELGATGLGEIYTFGPTFRAENSNTARHLAEFWMIEPEMAFCDLEDNANLAEEFIQYIIRYVMEHNADDLEFLRQRLLEEEKSKPQTERSELDLVQKLQFVVDNKFERITYTEAIDILLNSNHYKKKKFQYDVKWGIDMQSEHERYLVEKHFKKPVIVTNYPAAIKAFYMRQDEGCEPGRETVAAMDILAPGIGEIVGGSQREERYDKLTERMKAMQVPADELWWYLDTRRFGTVPHAGFGLGFERMVQFVTGMGNIRDVIPFPRTPKSAEF